MSRRLWLLLAVAVVSLLGSAPARAEPSWLVGTATVDITPPPFQAGDFPSCPAGAFPGPRPFAFEEPYVDTNGNGRFDYPEPYCDANLNRRYDGIYLSGGVDHLAKFVHDPIDARAIALSDGRKTVVVVSVVAQGIHETYTHRMRDRARALRPGIDELIVSSNHNESSPDTVGIYGAPNVADTAGGRSGIDDYYMSFLVDRVAQAAAQAYDARRPAALFARQFQLPSSLRVRLSHNFPTTDDARQPAAIDPQVGLLQARDAQGKPIFTLMSLAAHNQEIGHSDGEAGYQVSSDWPGYFHRKLESLVGGSAIFLVGDNGSEEDPETVPPLDAMDPHVQSRATGEALAATIAAEVPRARQLRAGRISVQRHEFFVPLENNLFRAAAQAGLFGDRQTYLDGRPAGTTGPDLRTEVAALDVGPDLQLLANPGEAFPALMLGSPWGIEDAGCPERPNPPVPTWHAAARYRFQVGLADDLIGYLIPAWANSSQPGVFPTSCVNDGDDKDPKGHQHKLETEGVGPAASNEVATQLTKLLETRPDPVAEIRRGRFVRADGSLSHSPAGAVAAWIADGGILVALPGYRAFGSRAVDVQGRFMDYDGALDGSAGITTRGMLVQACGGGVAKRYYLDVYPALRASSLGRAVRGSGPPGCAARRAACLPRSARVHSRSLAHIRVGDSRAGVLRRAGLPRSSRRRVLRYCVRGGGRVLVGLTRRGRVALVVSTARRHSARRVNRGSSRRALRRAYPHARRLRGTLFGTRTRLLFRVRHGRVRFVGLASRGLIARPRLLAHYVRMVGL